MSKNKKWDVYRWKWDNIARMEYVESVPLHLDMELNTNCNYHCIMCPFHGNRDDVPYQHMDFEMAKKVIDEFASKGGYAIKFVYRGEPLFYKDLGKIIKYAKEKGIIDTRVNTNGMLLTGDIAKELINAELDLLVFSIDSSEKETYEKIRRGGKFPSVVANVVMLQILKQFYGSKKPIVEVQCIIQDENKEEIESGKFKEFWSEIADRININPNCMEHQRTEIVDPTEKFKCESIWKRLTIWADGTIALCCGIDSDDKILGHINDDTIEEIWNGDDMNYMRELMSDGKAHLIPACRSCDVRRKFEKGELK